MNISSVLSNLGVTTVETAAKTKVSQSAENSIQAEDSYTSKLTAIAAKYDPTNISLSDIPNLAKDLCDMGLVSTNVKIDLMSTAQAQESAMKLGLTIGGMNVKGDGTVNLLAFYDSERHQQPVEHGRQLAEDAYETLDDLASRLGNKDTASTATVFANLEGQQSLNMHAGISAYKSCIDQSTFDNQKIIDVFNAMTVSRNDTLSS